MFLNQGGKLGAEGVGMTWIYEARLYDSKAVAMYVAMNLRDSGARERLDASSVQVYRTRRGNYGVRYRPLDA